MLYIQLLIKMIMAFLYITCISIHPNRRDEIYENSAAPADLGKVNRYYSLTRDYVEKLRRYEREIRKITT